MKEIKSNIAAKANDSVESTNETVSSKENLNLGGKKLMKNTIKENRAAELAAREAAEKAARRQEELDAIEPVDIIGTMDEVSSGKVHCSRDEEGYVLGVNGGELYQERIRTEDGRLTTIAAASPEKLAEVKANIEAGLSGDGMFHKLVYIGGMPCDCSGATLEKLEEDIKAAENFYRAHINGDVIEDVDVAEQLVDAGFKKEDLEQVVASCGGRFILNYEEKVIMDLAGNTVVDLSDLKSKLGREDIKTLLKERLENWIAEHECCCDDDYYEDDYDDEDYDGDRCDEDYDEDEEEDEEELSEEDISDIIKQFTEFLAMVEKAENK